MEWLWRPVRWQKECSNFNFIQDVVWQLQRGVIKLGGIVKAAGSYSRGGHQPRLVSHGETSHMQITASENPADPLYIATRALESDLRGRQCPQRHQVKGLNTYGDLGR